LVDQNIILPQHGTTTRLTAGLELHHLYTLQNYKYFEGSQILPTAIPFMNEGFFIVAPRISTRQTLVELLALSADKKFVGLFF
jgi:hypothetical protein